MLCVHDINLGLLLMTLTEIGDEVVMRVVARTESFREATARGTNADGGHVDPFVAPMRHVRPSRVNREHMDLVATVF